MPAKEAGLWCRWKTGDNSEGKVTHTGAETVNGQNKSIKNNMVNHRI